MRTPSTACRVLGPLDRCRPLMSLLSRAMAPCTSISITLQALTGGAVTSKGLVFLRLLPAGAFAGVGIEVRRAQPWAKAWLFRRFHFTRLFSLFHSLRFRTPPVSVGSRTGAPAGPSTVPRFQSPPVGYFTGIRSTTSERGCFSQRPSCDDIQASEFAATQVVPPLWTPGRLRRLRPSRMRFVTSPR